MTAPPPTSTLFPYTTLFRSGRVAMAHWDRRKVIGWAAVSVGGVILLAIVAGLLLLKTSTFQRYIIAKIERAAGKSTGSKIEDRKSTRLNSSHPSISYAVFCL